MREKQQNWVLETTDQQNTPSTLSDRSQKNRTEYKILTKDRLF